MTVTPELLKRHFPKLLNRFTRGEVQTLLGALTPIEAVPGQVVQRAGDPIDSLYLVCEGSVSLLMMVDGKPVPVGTLGPGQCFGSVALIEPGSALTTASVTEPSVLLRLDHAGFEALRTAHPRLGGLLLRALSVDLAERLRLYEEGMVGRTQPPGDAEEFARLCRPLLGVKAV